MVRTRHLLVLALAALAVVVAATSATARADDGNDVRVTRSCTAGSEVRLRVRERDDDLLRVDIDLRATRSGTAWIVTIVHERRLALRMTRRTGAGSRLLSMRVAIPDWPGRDTVTVRALGPRGEVCRAAATLADDVDDD
ncbi:MAG TPA: hypothetical protein VFG57_10115 [Gaiella sp.]|nr:hypothetical protein [Gaiella sp.]